MLGYLSSLPSAINLGLIWGVMAIGLFISYKILDIPDLTVDGSFATGGVVCVVLVASGVNVFLAMLIALLAGALCGLVTGALHAFLGIPAILAGILTQLMLWSINLLILGNKANLPCSARNYFLILSQGQVYISLGIAIAIIAVIILILYWFFGTEKGSSIRATGNNEFMARANGINTKANKILGLVISNALVALSGALLAQYQGFADINMGRGAIVIGLAAIVIGGALVKLIGRNFALQLSGVVVGSIIYYIIFQSVVFIIPDATNYLKLLSAVIVIIFLAIPYVKERYIDPKKISKEMKEHARTQKC